MFQCYSCRAGHFEIRSLGPAALFRRHQVFMTPTIALPPGLLGEMIQKKVGMIATEWIRRVPSHCSSISPANQRFY